jgi:flagella basal body P-ring formation protein FlgA
MAMRAILWAFLLATPAFAQVEPARAERPQLLVKRGEPVIIAVRSGGLTITSQGRALGSGGAGQSVRVVSADTHRTLDAIVDGPGSVRIPLP